MQSAPPYFGTTKPRRKAPRCNAINPAEPQRNICQHRSNLLSNAMLTTPKTEAELCPQYEALCRRPRSRPCVAHDPSLVPTTKLLHVIETDKVGVENGTYRGCLDGTWIPTSPDPMTWQRCGQLARKLREKGLKSIFVGDLCEEWYLYAIAHPLNRPRDVYPNVLQYYPRSISKPLVTKYRTLANDASAEEAERFILGRRWVS